MFLLDTSRANVFTSPYILCTGIFCQVHFSGASMNQKKADDPMQIFQKTVSYNSLLIEAMFEILAEKNVLTGEEVLERIKKLRDDGLSIPGRVN
jgi:hypothetical protein